MGLFLTRCRTGLMTKALLLVLALAACQPITRPASSTTPAPGATDLEKIPGMAMAQAQLAQQLQVDAAAITIISAEAVDWPDGCLGAGGPDEMCAAVITPGMKVIFKAADKEYEYRLSADGSQQRLVPTP